MSKRVVVIGAGWSGLAAAKTYLQINPKIDLTILDDDSSVGGVWSAARLYPGLIADSPNGLYEFSDLSMVTESQPKYRPIPGKQVQEYLCQYARKHNLVSRIRLGSKVVKAERTARGGWRVYTSLGDVLECEKLIVATGLYSKPYWPAIPRDDEFNGLVMHSKSLGQEHHPLATDEVKDVVVVGAGKSAIEASNICLAAGKRVHWIVRESTNGIPLIIVDPNQLKMLAANSSRLFGVWSPSIFTTSGFWYNLLHSGSWVVGNFLFWGFWTLLSYVVIASAGYDTSENGRRLKPKNKDLFRSTPHLCLLHTTNPFLGELRSGKNITVYRASPTRLRKEGMQLDTGEVLKADAVIYATGWRSSIDFFNDQEAAQLGIPILRGQQDVHQEKLWNNREDDADTTVTDILPQLANCPKPETEAGKTHFRLYRQVLSPRLLAMQDRSITFVGFVSTGQTSSVAELLSLWAVAWMEDIFPKALPTEVQMEEDVAKVNAWMARRYGARGRRDPEILIEIQTFFDLLMKDLDLRVHRKQKGVFGVLAEWLLPHQPKDYDHIIEELLAQMKPNNNVCWSLQEKSAQQEEYQCS